MSEALSLIRSLKHQSPNGNARRSTALAQALALQQTLFERAAKPKVRADHLASLARAWCVVQEAVRIMRGLPLPGQLRPDLDPVQLTRALKRSKSRSPILELANAKHFEAPEEAPAPAPDAATKKVKESLSREPTVTTGPPPGEP